ncbi:AraC-type DNA-binding protein [Granulicella pectinivorans]|uniref:AraC-type DNA-binding protein n=2 Tax=Granulicella pectinivorans TaxID=474950 RepID=A0A1I6LXG3_9BACT|nr:AraC-type DNA-binding protein [Granulicella pectinivorans]
MDGVRTNSMWKLRLHPSLGRGHQGPLFSSTDGLHDVTLIALVPRHGDRISVPRDEFLVTVYIGTGTTLEGTGTTRSEADGAFTQTPGEVSILGPRSLMVLSQLLETPIIQYRVPIAAIRCLAAHWKLGEVDSLKSPYLDCDPVLIHLSRVMCRLLERTPVSQTTIADHFVHSFYFHLLQQYGNRNETATEFSGGLSPRHKRIVEEALSCSSRREIKIKSVADQCGLSVGHFARVFRQTFGSPFHQHIMKIRIQRAKELLLTSDLSLGQISQTIGYADQATFTESFTRATRVSPGRFRREHLAARFA